MWMRRRTMPLLAVLVAAAWHVSASAQTIRFEHKKDSGPSHIELPLHAGANGRFADFLKSRDHAREAAESYKQLQELVKGLDKEDKEKLPKELFDKNGDLNPELSNEELQQLLNQLQVVVPPSYQGPG